MARANFSNGEAQKLYLAAVVAAGAEGVSPKALAVRFGVTPNAISMVLRTARGCFMRRGPARNVPGVWVSTQYATPAEAVAQRAVKPKTAVVCASGEGEKNDKTVYTVYPTGKDMRYTVKRLPPGYVSSLSASDCRPWAQAVAR